MSKSGFDAVIGSVSRRNFLKGIAAASAAVGTAAVLPGCGGGGEEGGSKIFRWGQANPNMPYDMQRSNNSGSETIACSVCEPLLFWNEKMELVTALAAEEPTWSDDNTTLTFKLKEGVKFHNGADFTAEDVKYTFTRMFKPDTAGLNTYMYDSIKGAKEMLAGETDELEGVEIIDDYTVAFHLTTPFVQFKDNMGIGYAEIFPHEACEEAGSDWGIDGNLIGTGPYKFVSGDSSKIVLEKNEEYHGGEPALDGVEITFFDDNSTKVMSFINDEIDACDLSSQLLDQYKDDSTVGPLINYFDTLGTYFIVMNLTDERFQDKRVREALSLAIDRHSIVDDLLSGAGTVCTSFLCPQIPGYTDEYGEYEYDPEKAKQLLKEAGATDLTIDVTGRSSEMETTVMTAVQDMWKQVGIEMTMQDIDTGKYYEDQAAGNLKCFIQGWFPLYANADNNMASYFLSENSPAKSSFYDSEEFDELMISARAEVDDAARAELYKKADYVLTRQDVGCIPLFWSKMQFLAKDNVHMTCSNLVYQFNNITMD